MNYDYLKTARDIEDQLIAWRRDFHQHPELGFQEERTSRIIAEVLRKMGWQVTTGVGKTGVVGLLEGAHPGPVVMIRVDIDALPIQEETKAEFASVVPGVMHACGHDGHTAIGLGVALMYAHFGAENLHGTLKLIFQPAEEIGKGAEAMISDRVLDNPQPDVVLGLHLINELPVGDMVVRPGYLTTFHDRFTCRITGKGGHGAIPHLNQDPIVAAGYIITALQTVVSRNISPLETGVVSVGTMKAEGAWNVIPESVLLTGTMRAFKPQIREIIHNRTRDIVEGIARSLACESSLEIEAINPAIYNDPQVSRVVRQAVASIIGDEHINDTFQSSASDDVAFFTQRIPGSVFYIGSSNPQKGLTVQGHNSHYDIDEAALALGTAALVASIAQYLLHGDRTDSLPLEC